MKTKNNEIYEDLESPKLTDIPINYNNGSYEKDAFTITISTGIRCHCGCVDVFGQCAIEDCLSCANAKVKIVRNCDGYIFRNE